MFETAHIFIAGFSQRIGISENGIYSLFDRVYRRYAGPKTLVLYFPCYVHPRDLGNMLADCNRECVHQTGFELDLQIIGYSFGGQTAAHVCQELFNRSVSVDHLVLCDPVARFGRLGWLRAANPFSRIRVPRNVNSLDWFTQHNPRWSLEPPFFHPRGHDVGWDGGKPDRRLIQRDHSSIDNSAQFHRAVMESAEIISGRVDDSHQS